MDQEKHTVPRRPVWAWLTFGGGITLIALVGVSVVALSQRPFPDQSPDRRVHAEAPAPSVPAPDEQLAITPPPPPVVPPMTEDTVPPTMGPPGSPPPGPPPSGPPVWPPTRPPSDMRGTGVGVPGPSQAIRPEPRRILPAPSTSAPRGGRDG